MGCALTHSLNQAGCGLLTAVGCACCNLGVNWAHLDQLCLQNFFTQARACAACVRTPCVMRVCALSCLCVLLMESSSSELCPMAQGGLLGHCVLRLGVINTGQHLAAALWVHALPSKCCWGHQHRATYDCRLVGVGGSAA